MIFITFFLLFITILGIVSYVYLRQVQEKIAKPKDKYDEAQNELNKNKQLMLHTTLTSSIIFKRILMFLYTIGFMETSFLMFSHISDGHAITLRAIGSCLLLLGLTPLWVLIFPSGLIELIVPSFDMANNLKSFILSNGIGLIIYATIFLLGIRAKNRKVFTYVYIVFIILLILNIKGCENLRQEIANQIFPLPIN
jgi:hypothetical protein